VIGLELENARFLLDADGDLFVTLPSGDRVAVPGAAELLSMPVARRPLVCGRTV